MVFATIHFAELALLGLLLVSTGFLVQCCLPQLRVAELGEMPVRLTLGL